MSWKGFQKAVSRLPHQIMSKKSEVTRDPDFDALEKRFVELGKVVERLGKDAQQFRDGISALLTHQTSMASFLTVIYDTNLGVEVTEGAIQKRFQQTPAPALQAVHDAEAAMSYCRDEVLPELDAVDRDVVRPTLELQEIIRRIQKTIIKRQHKLIDYDRFRTSVNKLKGKETRSFNEEKEIFKLDAKLETATQDYNYLNDMLKQQMPQFFYLKSQFITPIFENFYRMQTKIYGIIYARCYELANANGQHFITTSMPITDGFEWRRLQRDVRAEMENMDLLKSGGKAWLAVSGGANNSKLSLQERAALREQEKTGGMNGGGFNDVHANYGYQSPVPPPAYGGGGGVGGFESVPIQAQQKQSPEGWSGQNTASPMPSSTYVLALYDYQAQAAGDLSFKKDDKIEVVQRTQDANDWWTGRVNGVTGIFPGNYVRDL
ncbi:hypothetical protein CLU79DRAFT_750221 [Phycomyces nitens]|nr:hypothetical protein CLU79DRAFT_750221 [Phycomyces nitens]